MEPIQTVITESGATLLRVYQELKDPIFSVLWGTLSLVSLTALTGAAAFLARLAYLLRVPNAWVLVVLLVAYCLITLDFPHPTIRTYLSHQPTPPLDTVRLALLGLILGLGAWFLSSGISLVIAERRTQLLRRRHDIDSRGRP